MEYKIADLAEFSVSSREVISIPAVVEPHSIVYNISLLSAETCLGLWTRAQLMVFAIRTCYSCPEHSTVPAPSGVLVQVDIGERYTRLER